MSRSETHAAPTEDGRCVDCGTGADVTPFINWRQTPERTTVTPLPLCRRCQRRRRVAELLDGAASIRAEFARCSAEVRPHLERSFAAHLRGVRAELAALGAEPPEEIGTFLARYGV